MLWSTLIQIISISKMDGRKRISISSGLTLFIIALLLLIGPITALTITVTTDQDNYYPDNTVKFTATVNLNSDEAIPVSNVYMNITGSTNNITNCNLPFNDTGYSNNQTVSCTDNLGNTQTLKATLSPSTGFAFGYGNMSAYSYNNATFGYTTPSTNASSWSIWNNTYGYGYISSNQIVGTSSFIYTIYWDIPTGWTDSSYITSVALNSTGLTFWNKKTISIYQTTIAGSYTNSSVSTTADTVTRITANTTSSTNVVLGLVTSANTSGSVTVVEYNSSNYTVPSGYTAFGKYIGIDVSSLIAGNFSWAWLNISYTDAELTASGLNESSLKLYYYNSTAGAWYTCGQAGWSYCASGKCGVDTTNNVLWANVTHFSLFGIFGTVPTTTTTTTTTTGGDSKLVSITAPETVEIGQGEFASVAVTIKNTGTLALSGLTLSLTGVESTWFDIVSVGSLATVASKDTSIIITVPSDAELRNYSAKLKVSDASGSVGTKGLTIIVVEKVEPTECPACSACSDWSDCVDNKKTRTCYKCDASTNYQCQSYTETKDCIPFVEQIKKTSWIVMMAWGVAVVGLIVIVLLLTRRKKPEHRY